MESNIAILILAHHKQKQLFKLITHLSLDFDVFVQIDAESDLNISELPQKKNTFYFKEISVFWGDYSQIENMRFIFEKAFKQNSYDYYFLISGDDLPLKSNREIKKFVAENHNNCFMYINPLPMETWGFNKGFDRLDRYWFMKIKHRPIVKIIGRITLGIQKLLSIKVKRFPINYYAGSGWLNINQEAMSYLFHFLEKNPDFLNKLKYSRATDEIWVQTILMNSPLKDKIVHNDMRYIDWTSGPELPRVLNHEDWDKLKETKALFARKFDLKRDPDFVDKWFKNITN